MCNLGPDGRRRDADDRPELCRGTVEFVATKEFLVCAYLIHEVLVTSASSHMHQIVCVDLVSSI